MSLIQRAVERGKSPAKAETRVPTRPEPVETGPVRPAAPSSPELFTQPTPQLDTNLSKPIELDQRWLRKKGLLIPGEMKSALALEVGVIKRRLLRRLGFLASSQKLSVRHRRNTVLISSANPGEGKTFNAVNLALSITYDEQIPVILIDCDTVRPQVAASLGLEVQRGLSDVLSHDGQGLMEVALRVRDTQLTIIPEGERRLPIAEIFSNSRLCAELDILRNRHPEHIIIVDTPPLLATSEASILADHVDEVVLVVHGTRTTRKSVHAALEMLDCDDRTSLIMNHCPDIERQHGYRYSYYESYVRGGDD